MRLWVRPGRENYLSLRFSWAVMERTGHLKSEVLFQTV